MGTGMHLGRAAPARRLRVLILLLMLVAALAAVDAAAVDGLAITRHALLGGGVTQSGDMRLTGVIGESVVGRGTAGDMGLGGGFLAPDVWHSGYLPLVK